MRDKQIELRIIKLSVLLACLVIFAGVALRLIEPKTEAVNQIDLKPNAGTTQGANTPNSTPATGNLVVNAEQQSLSKGKIIAIGDSYTYGYPYGTESSWVSIAAKDLSREIVNKGKTLQNSSDLLARFSADVLDEKPESVIILVGTGDGIRGIGLETYQKNVQEMVRLAKSKNITPILGLPLPYPDSTAATLINSYKTWLSGFAQSGNMKIIDFSSDLLDTNGSLRKQFTDDGKYPNKQGYSVMAQTVEKSIKN